MLNESGKSYVYMYIKIGDNKAKKVIFELYTKVRVLSRAQRISCVSTNAKIVSGVLKYGSCNVAGSGYVVCFDGSLIFQVVHDPRGWFEVDKKLSNVLEYHRLKQIR